MLIKIDKNGLTFKYDTGIASIMKTCPNCFICFYGDPKVKLEKCNECSEEKING